jgi:hypothetical protein
VVDIREARKRLDEVLTYAPLDRSTRDQLKSIRALLGETRTGHEFHSSWKAQARDLKRLHPDWTDEHIALMVGTTADRVAESLSGALGEQYRP